MFVLLRPTRTHLTDPSTDERAVESLRPMSFTISRQAIQLTPKIGDSEAATSPDSLRSTLSAYSLVPVTIPEIPTPSLPTLEEILCVRLSLVSRVLLTSGKRCSVQDRT